MTGHAGLNSNLRCFEVANLADEYHVGILAQDRAQNRCECQPLARGHLNLGHAGKFVFDRILHRHDVDLARCEFPQCRVEQGRFSGPRRTGHDDQAVLIGEQLAKTLQFRIRQVQIPEQLRLAGAKQAYDGLLRLSGRHGRNPQIASHTAGLDSSPTRVRAKSVRHIHTAHHLES